MNIKEFMEGKYGRSNVSSLTMNEAIVFGIANDLSIGWPKKYGEKEITIEMALLLLKKIYEKPRSKDRKAIRVLIENYPSCAHYANHNVLQETKYEKKLRVKQESLKKKDPVYPVTITKFNTEKIKKDLAYATSPDFLLSYEWRRVRLEVLKKYGARCQCCGASPDTGAVMNVDHIKPRKTHPELCLDISNLQVLCDACNHGKGNWDKTDWRPTEDKTYDPVADFNDRFK